MRIPLYALGAGLSIALLAGCGGGSQSTAVPPGVSPQTLTGQSASRHPFGMANIARSNWVVPPSTRIPQGTRVPGQSFFACTATNLLFVSDASNNVVQIYDRIGERGATACGTISGNGLSQPQGIDVATNGNLWVANTNTSQLFVFAPPYTGAPTVINDSGQYPAGVDADCGKKVAVTNIITTAGGAGSLLIMNPNGSGQATHSDPNASREYFPACDPKGNVYTTYSTSAGTAGLNKFTAPAYGATDLTNWAGSFPGGLDYEGTNLLVDDQTGHTIQSCAGGTGTCTTIVTMSSASDPVTFDTALRGETDLFTADAGLAASQLWSYEGGGDLDATVSVGGLPIGAAVYKDPR
jgi:hypothetical protein